MTEITFEYWNEIADQILTISALLGGFSIAIVANLLVSNTNTKLFKNIMIVSALASCFFLITVFSMNNILMKTTIGNPLKIIESDLIFPRRVGIIFFTLGVISLTAMISLAGWTKSKKTGIFTTILGILTLILILIMAT